MNTVSAQEINRRGVAALQEAAEEGAVHVLKHNRVVGVFLNEEDYQELMEAQSKKQLSVMEWLSKNL
ncbi:MAG: hypothetical protein ACWA5U_10860 [bacterium]